MDEIGYAQNDATTIYEDNEASIKIANNPRCHDRLKHVALKYHITRDAITNKQINVVKIATSEQDADVLTKPLIKAKHWHHVDKMLN